MKYAPEQSEFSSAREAYSALKRKLVRHAMFQALEALEEDSQTQLELIARDLQVALDYARDPIGDPKELEVLTTWHQLDLAKLSGGPKHKMLDLLVNLIEFIVATLIARQCRMAGNLTQAEEIEAAAQKMYDALPEPSHPWG